MRTKLFVLACSTIILCWVAWHIGRSGTPSNSGLSQKDVEAVDNALSYHLPRFEDFPVRETNAHVVSDDMRVNVASHPLAETVASILTEGFSRGPNFAGSYTVVTWSCGEMCQLSAILDALGNIIVFGILSMEGISFRHDSKLLAINPRGNSGVEQRFASDYYLFEDETLRHLVKIAPDGTFLRVCPQLPIVARNPVTGEQREFSTPCAVPVGWEER